MSDVAGTAIERLYREEGSRLWRAVWYYCGDRETASDAVAEAFARALRYENQIQDPRAWVWRTAFRLAAAELRQRRRSRTGRAEVSNELADAPFLLATVLPRLSPKQRSSVILHYYAGYPVADVARIIGSTPSAVGVHLFRARARIRQLIEDVDED